MSISIRPLKESELAQGNHIFRIAFGTFVKSPIPANYGSDLNYMNRWYIDPKAAFAAEIDGQLVGVNIATNWGSFGLFGPLIVHPDFWEQGIGKKLIEPAIACFESWNIKQAGFCTFANSPKHLYLYQKFGFHPRFLIAFTSKQAQSYQEPFQGLRYSQLGTLEQTESLKNCYELTDKIYDNLDLRSEIATVNTKKLGDTILLWGGDVLLGFAICHCGENTEAGKDICYVKFAAVRPGAKTEEWFEKLLQECEKFAVEQKLSRLVCGMSTERDRAYGKMIALGFKVDRLAVAMHKPNKPAYNRSDVFVIDDWR